MSTIDLKWSTAAAALHANGQSRLETPLGNAIDSLLPTASDMARATFDIGGSALTAYLGNGATLAVGGLGLGQSVITADSLQLYRGGVGSIDLAGQYAIRYAMVGGAPQIQGFTGQVSSVSIASQWQPGSAGYDAAIGNVSVRATGSLSLDGGLAEGLAVRGRLNELAFSTTSGILHGSVKGEFVADGKGDMSSAIVTEANFGYADGSYLRAGGTRIDASDLTLSGVAEALGNAANFDGDDVMRLDVATSDILPMISTGTGNDRITLTGGADFSIATGDGDDVVTLLMGRSSIQGGDGLDTAVIAGMRADFAMSQSGSWHVFIGVGRKEGHNAGLHDVERVHLDDGAIAFDIDGHAGQAYRLYTAALGRAPDAGGLGYWMSMLDAGTSLHAVASGFVASDEFQALAGAGADNAAFLVKLYDNILHRAPDASGLRYWQGVLEGGGDRAGVVTGFSESAENQAQVIAAIQHGIAYTPYG